MSSKREHPCLPVYRRLFDTHPKTQMREWADGYLPPDEVLSKSCPRRKGVAVDNREGVPMRAEFSGVRSLFPHVDPIALYRNLSIDTLNRQIQREEDALRLVAPEVPPKDLFSFVYGDANYGCPEYERYIDEGAVRQHVVLDKGTPYSDLGSSDARKPMQSWRSKDAGDPTTLFYNGPQLLVVDKIDKSPNLQCPSMGAVHESSLETSNMLYRQVDVGRGLSTIPKTSLLTSVNLLTQLDEDTVVEIMQRDSLHIVPDIQKLLAHNMGDRIDDSTVKIRARGNNGQIVEYLDNDHDFTFVENMPSASSEYHKLVVSFAKRRLVFDGFGDSFDRPISEQPQLMKKPLRYTARKTPGGMVAPYKLKWDGVTTMFDFRTDSAKVHHLKMETQLELGDGYKCDIRTQLVCESILVGDVNHIFPFAVIIAGRRFNGETVLNFMRRTELSIPGYVFHEPEFFDTIDAAVLAMSATRFCPLGLVADGITAVGGAEDEVAKLFETIDITPCDDATLRFIVETISPMSLEFTMVEDMRAACEYEKGQSNDHRDCMVKEFYMKESVELLRLLKKCDRPDKEKGNAKKQLVKMLPAPLEQMETPKPKLKDLLSTATVATLEESYQMTF